MSEIETRTEELAARICSDYQKKDLVLLGILKGAVFFLTDLARLIRLPLTVEFMRLSSFGDETTSRGEVRILADITQSIEGKDMLVVEDIIDTGRTIHFLLEHLKKKRPASVKVCSLLYKPARNKIPVTIDYLGFEVPNVFVVGYGMDYKGRYRNLPFIGTLSGVKNISA